MQNKLYHLGFRSHISRSTLADANENRDWRIYADFAQLLINDARKLYSDEDFAIELDNTIYALDSTTIDLCLSLFPWASFRKHKGAIKDELIPEPGSFYIMDRGYLDFARLYYFQQYSSFFVIRAKSNLQFRRLYSHPIDKSTGIKCDQTILLTGFYPSKDYPDKLRRVKYYDNVNDRNLTFLTNNFILPALTIAKLYKSRWQIELFFKWIKQHLRIKSFYGTSENAVKTQIWIAISIYVLVAIVKKQLKIAIPLYTFLQILSVSVFENNEGHISNQLNLFDL